MGELFSWFKTRQATSIFAIGSLVSGFLFISQNITGNAIINNSSSFNVLSLIGLLLILCSVILGVYSIRKR
tara:strand:- start:575 stop:787 length:213 start_codon:yes stop_codon:yes gene_type:complete